MSFISSSYGDEKKMGVENNKVIRDFVKTHQVVRNIALNAKVFTLPTTKIYSVCVTA